MTTPEQPKTLEQILRGLTEEATGFLAKVEQQRQQQQQRVPPEVQHQASSGDGFESLYRRLKSTIGVVADGVVAAVENKIATSAQGPSPSIVTTEDPPVPAQSAPISPSVMEILPSESLLTSLRHMFSQLSEDQAPSHLPHSSAWVDLDQLTSAVRGSWVKLISAGSKPHPKAGLWLEEWSDILSDMQHQAILWPSPHGSAWASWSKDRLAEAQHLKAWLGQGNTSVQESSLSVPVSFKNTGLFPAAPAGVPSDIVAQIRSTSDYWEWAQKQPPSKLSWSNTPAQTDAENNREHLENWTPEKEDQKVWKEQTLDRYAVIAARMTLLTSPITPIPPAPSKAPRKSHKP